MSTTPDAPTVEDLKHTIAARDSEIADLQRELEHWRTKAVVGWSTQANSADSPGKVTGLSSEFIADRETLSWCVNLGWRVTVPLQFARHIKRVLGAVSRKVTGR